MILKKIFFISLPIILLSACSGSDNTATQSSEESSVVEVVESSVVGDIDLTGVIANNITPKTQLAGVVTSNKSLISSAAANAQAQIISSKIDGAVQGNITFLVQATDDDSIAQVTLFLPNVDKSLTLCAQECGVSFEKSVIGLNPYFYGENAGEVRLEIWLTDELDNQILADAITVSWQPHQISGVTAIRNNQDIEISWQENPDLNRYNIYLATQAGVSPQSIDTLENGQQFLSLTGSTFTFNNSLTDRSYQILITGIDGSGESGFSTLLNIAPVDSELNFPPQAQRDTFQVNEDKSIQGNVLINDININDGVLTLNVDALIPPSHGNITIDESGTFTYIPTANFNGEDTFSYQVVNELGMTDIGIVEIIINAQNDAPIALGNNYSISFDGSLIVSPPGLLINDSDVDLDSLTVDTTPIISPSKGTLILFSDGSFEYQGEDNMQGNDSFQYRIFDGQGAEDIAEVIIVGDDANVAPVATNDTYNLNEDSVASLFNVLSNDIDADGDSLTISSISLDIGTADIVNNQIQYTAPANINGVAVITYTISDGNGGTDTGILTITITAINDAPVASNQVFDLTENATDGDMIGNIIATDVEQNSLNYVFSGGDTTLFNLSNSGVLTVNSTTSFNHDTTPQYILSVSITDDGTPNETTTINVTVNITIEELIPVEDTSFGRIVNGEFNFSSDSSGGELNDSVQLGENIYFAGYSNNTDQDIFITSYSIDGSINTDFGSSGVKMFDFSNDENATAITSDGTNLFVAYSSFDGTNTEVCFVKLNTDGNVINDQDLFNGIHCTELDSTLVINDLEYIESRVQAVGTQSSDTGTESLWIKFDPTTLNYENSSPIVTSIGQHNKAFSLIKINNNSMIVGSITSATGDKDAFIRVLSNGTNQGGFNGGNPVSIDISGESKNDELFASASLITGTTAYIGGYVTSSTNEKEAVVIALSDTGTLVSSFGIEGIATYDIDGNSNSDDGGAEITGLTFDSTDNYIIISGTTGKNIDDTYFTARILATDGSLDTNYASSGINIISGIDGTQVANSLTIDTNDSLWISGANNTTSAPFIAATDSTSALLTDFSGVGYLDLDTVTSTDSNAQSLQVLQLVNGAHASKYIFASVVGSSSTTLVLTRLTSTGIVDTTFGTDGHQYTTIELSTSEVTLIEDASGNIIVVGSYNATSGKEEGVIARFDQNGNLDSSFASSGLYDTDALTTTLVADSLKLNNAAIDSNNNIVAVGSFLTNGIESSFALRLTSTGLLDSTLNGEGFIQGSAIERYETVFIDNSGNIFAGGKIIDADNSTLLVRKFDSLGDPDTTFASAGTYSGSASPDGTNKLAKIFTDSTNNLYLIANKFDGPSEANIIKLSSTGTLDTSFATDGEQEYSLAITGDTKIYDAVLDSTGKIVLSGIANDKGMLARISVDGSLDNTFGLNGVGYYQSNQCANEHTFTSLILQTDSQIVVSNTCNNGSTDKVSATKFNFYDGGVEP